MPNNSSPSLWARWARYPNWASLEQFLAGVQTLNPLLVLLFGSVARGTFTQHSDLDVLVVTREAVDWVDVYAFSDGRVQPVVHTLAEMEQQIARGEPFFCEMIEDGIVLHDSDLLHDHLRSLVEAARRQWGLVREGSVWRWQVDRAT